MPSANITKIRAIPLAAYGPPALLVLSADAVEGLAICHAYLLPPEGQVIAQHFQLANSTAEFGLTFAEAAIQAPGRAPTRRGQRQPRLALRMKPPRQAPLQAFWRLLHLRR